jgi:hypothetical protein
MAEQRELHGKAQTIGSAAPACHKILVRSRERVMTGQGVRIAGHAQQQPAFLVCQQLSARQDHPPCLKTVHHDCGNPQFEGRILWTMPRFAGCVVSVLGAIAHFQRRLNRRTNRARIAGPAPAVNAPGVSPSIPTRSPPRTQTGESWVDR